MKKLLSLLVAFVVVFTLSIGSATEVAAASGSFSGPSSVKSGETFYVSYTINTNKCYGINASFAFDTSLLKLNAITDNSGASVEYQNNTAFLDIVSSPASGSVKILNFNFTAIGAAGVSATIKLSAISVTEENYIDVGMPDVNHAVTISNSSSNTPSSSSTPPASVSSITGSTQQGNQSTGSTATINSTPASTSGKPGTTASKNPSSTSTSSEPVSASVESTTEETDTSKVDSSNVSTKDKTSDSSKTNDTEDDKSKNSSKKIIVVIVCVVVLCGAVGILLYIKKQKEDTTFED